MLRLLVSRNPAIGVRPRYPGSFYLLNTFRFGLSPETKLGRCPRSARLPRCKAAIWPRVDTGCLHKAGHDRLHMTSGQLRAWQNLRGGCEVCITHPCQEIRPAVTAVGGHGVRAQQLFPSGNRDGSVRAAPLLTPAILPSPCSRTALPPLEAEGVGVI